LIAGLDAEKLLQLRLAQPVISVFLRPKTLQGRGATNPVRRERSSPWRSHRVFHRVVRAPNFRSQTFKNFSFLLSPTAPTSYAPSQLSPNLPTLPPPFYSSLESASRVHSRPLKFLCKEPPRTNAPRRSPVAKRKGRGCAPALEKRHCAAHPEAA
jgi:hypothetical protein